MLAKRKRRRLSGGPRQSTWFVAGAEAGFLWAPRAAQPRSRKVPGKGPDAWTASWSPGQPTHPHLKQVSAALPYRVAPKMSMCQFPQDIEALVP